MERKAIFIFFLAFPVFLLLHFSYGLIVREPYPSFMMPGFSRIDNSNGTYTLNDKRIILTYENGQDTIGVKPLAASFSKIAISRAIDNAFFDSQLTHNTKQKGYYAKVQAIIGEKAYKKYVLEVRNHSMSVESIERFEEWLIVRSEAQAQDELFSIEIERIKVVRNFSSGEVVEQSIIDSRKIEV